MSELVPNALHAELRALIASSRQRLAQEFGRGFKAKNLRRRMQSTQAFPLPGIVATLSRQLSWSKSCTQRCLKRVSGWHGAGCCWGTWMTTEKPLPRLAEMCRNPATLTRSRHPHQTISPNVEFAHLTGRISDPAP